MWCSEIIIIIGGPFSGAWPWSRNDATQLCLERQAPLNSVFAPSRVEAYVQWLQVLFHRTHPGGPWPACRSLAFFWEAPDCCLHCAGGGLRSYLYGRRGQRNQAFSPLLLYRCRNLSGLNSFFHVGGVPSVRDSEKASNSLRIMSVVVQVSQPYRRTGVHCIRYTVVLLSLS